MTTAFFAPQATFSPFQALRGILHTYFAAYNYLQSQVYQNIEIEK
jgi:hypothetical protein